MSLMAGENLTIRLTGAQRFKINREMLQLHILR